jgi:splicing factor 4
LLYNFFFFRFLFDKNCVDYLQYRREVIERRKMDKYDPLDELQYEDYMNLKNAPSTTQVGPKTFGSTQEKTAKTVTVIRNDDSESTNSDTETWRNMHERNLKNLKRKAIHSRSRKQQEASTSDSSDDENNKDNPRYYDRKYKMSSTSSSSSNSKKSADPEQQTNVDQSSLQLDKSDSSSRPPKRKKSRWSEAPAVTTATTVTAIASATTAAAATTATTTTIIATASKPMLATVMRSDPALQNYARQNFGTTNLSEDDWMKAEEHYKINLLFQDMQRKRQEIDQLAKNGKFKYEYDSDEDVNGGTWEHKLRAQEMEATLKWAEALSQQCSGKHHIGDFLPPGMFL